MSRFEPNSLPFMWLPGLPVPLEPKAADYYNTSARIEILHMAEPQSAGHQGLWLYAAPGSGVWWEPGRRLVKKNSIDAVLHFSSLERVVRRYEEIETNIVSPAAAHVKRWKVALGNHSWNYTVQMAANGTECFGLLAMVTQFLVHFKPLSSGLSGTEHSWATTMRNDLLKEGIDSIILTEQSHYWPRHEAARFQFHNIVELVAQCKAGERHPHLRKVPEIIDFRYVGPGAERLLRYSAAASADGSQPCAIAATTNRSCTSCTHAGRILCECDATKHTADKKHSCCLDGGAYDITIGGAL